MITIHTPTTSDFSNNGLGVLEPLSCVISVTINGAWSLELEHPFDEDEKYKKIEKNNIIKVTDIPIIREQTSTYQLFRIYDTVRTLSSVRAIAFPVAFEATYDAIIEELNITKKSATAALQDIMTYLSAHGVSKYTVTSDYTQQGVTIRQKKGKWASTNLIAAISGSDDGSIINKWGGEVAYDNYHIIVNGRLGSTTDYDLRYGKNLTGLSVDVDTSGVVTRFYPVSSDNVRFKKTVNNAEVGYVQSPDHFDDYPFARGAFVQAPYKLIDTTWEVGEPHTETQIKTHEAIEALTEDIEDVAQDLWSKLNHGQEWHNKWYEPEWVQSILNDAIAQCQKDVTANITHPTWKSVIQSCIKEGLSYIKNQEIPDFYWEEETVDNEKVYFYTNGQRYITNQYYYVDKKYCKFNSAGNYEPPADEPTFDWIQKKGSNSAKKFGNNKHYMAHNEDVYITMNGTLVRYYMDDEGWYDNNEDESDWTKHNWGTSSAWFGEEGATESDTGKYAHDTWLFIDGTYYYFNSKGYITDQKNDYRWDWVEDKEKYWFGNKINHEYGAVYVTNQWLKIDGEWHKFKADGTLTNMKQLKTQFITLLSTNLATAITETIDHHQGYLYSTLYEQMEDYCEQLFEEGADVPVVNVTANLVDLSKTAEYSDIFESDNTLKSIRLGDDVMLRDFVHQIYDKKHAPNEPEYKDEVEERVVGLKYDCIKGYNTEVTISDPYKQFIIKTSGKASTKHYDTLQGGNVALGSISSTIGLIAGENIQIDEDGVIRAFGEVGDVFAGTQVSYSPSITSGTLLGTIYINGVEYGIYSDGGGSDVDVTRYFSEGHKIAKIEVDDTSTDIYSPIDISYGYTDPTTGRDREFYNKLEKIVGYDDTVYPYTPSYEGTQESSTGTHDTYSYYTGDLASINDLYHIDISKTSPVGLFTMANHPNIVSQGENKHNVHGLRFNSSSDMGYAETYQKFVEGINIPKYFVHNGHQIVAQNYKYVYVAMDDEVSIDKIVYISNTPLQCFNMRSSSGQDSGVELLAQSTDSYFIRYDDNWDIIGIYQPWEELRSDILSKSCWIITQLYFQIIYANARIDAVERTSSQAGQEAETDNFELNYLLGDEYNGSAYSIIKNIFVKRGNRWIRDRFQQPKEVVALTQDEYDALPSSKNSDNVAYFINIPSTRVLDSNYSYHKYGDNDEIVVRVYHEGQSDEVIRWYFNGWNQYAGDVAPPTSLVPYMPTNTAPIMSYNYRDASDFIDGWIGFYNGNIRAWNGSKDYLSYGTKYGVVDLSQGEEQYNALSDPYVYIDVAGSYKIVLNGHEYSGSGSGLGKVTLYSGNAYAATINLSESYNGYDLLMIETYNSNDKKNQSTILSVSDLSSGSYVGIDNYLLYTITNTRTLTFHDDFDDTNHSRYIKAVYGLSTTSGGGGSDSGVLDVEVDGVSVVSDRVAEITLSPFTGATAQANGAKGQVPQPLIADKDKFLKGDGTWATPTDTTYNDYNGSAHGLVAPPSTTGSGRYLKEDGTWDTPSGGGGTTVVANPSGTATADLEKLQVGNTIYEIPTGGSGADISQYDKWEHIFKTHTSGGVVPNTWQTESFTITKSDYDTASRDVSTSEWILQSFACDGLDSNNINYHLNITIDSFVETSTTITIIYSFYNYTSGPLSVTYAYFNFVCMKKGTSSGGGGGVQAQELSQTQYDALTQAQKTNGTIYFVHPDTQYEYHTNQDGTLVVRIDPIQNKTLWFFCGYTKTASDIAPPSELTQYAPSNLLQASNYPNKGVIQNGWVGFYLGNIRTWTQDTAQLMAGTFWGVLDVDGAQQQITPYYDPYDTSGQCKIYFMGTEYANAS